MLSFFLVLFFLFLLFHLVAVSRLYLRFLLYTLRLPLLRLHSYPSTSCQRESFRSTLFCFLPFGFPLLCCCLIAIQLWLQQPTNTTLATCSSLIPLVVALAVPCLCRSAIAAFALVVSVQTGSVWNDRLVLFGSLSSSSWSWSSPLQWTPPVYLLRFVV